MADDVTTPGFMRGAIPTPRHKLQASMPYVMPVLAAEAAPPVEFAVIPPQLSMWGNSQYGDCVSAEEAFAKAAWSVQCGLPETFITEHDVIAWATKYGFRDGAYLTEVMDVMKVHGMPAGGQTYIDGNYVGVDYSNEDLLKSALTQGPVKIGIDANGLPSGAGDHNGWFSVSTTHHNNEDHCVALTGYGSAAFLFGKLGVPVPSGLAADTPGYLLFTWNTIGFVTHGWLMGSCQEAWLRLPTTVGQGPSPVPPSPPVPVPPSPPSPPVPPVPPVPPSPPVPPVPPVPVVISRGTVQIPAQSISFRPLSGHAVVPAQSVPVVVTSAPQGGIGSPNYTALLLDLLALFQTPEAKKVIADLGL
jgi:hypothetical protein